MKMDDKPNPDLPMYRETLGAFLRSPTGEPRRLFAYLQGTTVVPCTALELARHPGGPAAEDFSRKTALGDTVITTRFSPVRLDRLRRMLPPLDEEPLWFETTIHTVGREDDKEYVGYYKTYEEALNGHGKIVHARMKQSETTSIID